MMPRVLPSVRGRIIAGIGLMVAILVTVATGSAWLVFEHRSTTAALQERAEITFLILDGQANAESAAAAIQRYVIVGDDVIIPGNDDNLLPLIDENVTAAVDDLTQAILRERAQGDTEDLAVLNEIMVEATALVQDSGQIIAHRQAGNVAEATALFEAIVPKFRVFEGKLNEVAEGERAEASKLREEADQAGARALWILMIAGSLGAVLGLGAAIVIARSIIRPLSRVESAAMAVAGGDLQARSPESGPDEFVRLGSSINRMTESLLDASKRRELEEDRERAYVQLRESQRLLLESQSVAQVGSYVLDVPAGVWESSPVLDGIFGIDEGFERSVESWLTLVHPDDRQMMGDYFAHDVLEEHGRFDKEYKILSNDDATERWVLGLGILEFDAEGQPLRMVGTIQDITERKRAEETIRQLAYHDGLTGLPNRTLFEDRVTVALAQAQRKEGFVAVMFLDLDRFKIVNDTVGHTFGDQLLREVADTLSNLVREGDTVARMGGDEFTLLLPEVIEASEAVEIAERILETLRQPWKINGREYRVTTSIGIALNPSDGETAQSLLRNADTAMYRAKEQGRDNYQLYTAAMNNKIMEQLALENSLRDGIKQEEFVVHYQPQVEISSGRIVGTEALVRWQHPERGLVSPIDFIPVAEETGLIVPLGAWVLQTACDQNMAWQQAGHAPIPVAVNLSARQFQERDLLDTVTQTLEESGMDPEYLQLEITEGAAMQDVESTTRTLRALREMGVQIAIDDFGTGHSSLSYLRSFPVSALKIDSSFVRDLTIDPNDAAITAAILAMADSLALKVIAEGVETEEQLAFLSEHGCDEMQGFLFSKAVPPDEFEELLGRDGLGRNVANRVSGSGKS